MKQYNNINFHKEIMDNQRCNFIETVGLTTGDIIRVIKESDYEVVGLSRDLKTEYQSERIPLFAATFYAMVLREGRHLSQEEFVKEYLDTYIDQLVDEGVVHKFNVGCFANRLRRAFSSFQSELYAQALLEESGQFDGVYYNVDLDIKNKIDVLVRKDDKYVGLELYLDTPNARKEYAKKVNGRVKTFKGVDIHPVSVPLSTRDNKKVKPKSGDVVFLYKDDLVEFVLEQFELLNK